MEDYKLLFKAELIEVKDDIDMSLPFIDDIGHVIPEKKERVTFDIADTSKPEALAQIMLCKEEHRQELRKYIFESNKLFRNIKNSSRLNPEEIAMLERLFDIHIRYGKLIDVAISELFDKATHIRAVEKLLNPPKGKPYGPNV